MHIAGVNNKYVDTRLIIYHVCGKSKASVFNIINL